MKIIQQTELNHPCVATVGFFDGVHLGHRFLIQELILIANKRKLPSLVITFAEHPRKVLHSDYQPQLLTSLEEKLFQLKSTGVDECVVLNFTPDLSQLSAYDFLNLVLKKTYSVDTLLIGHDHRFGHNRLDGIEQYQQYGKMIGISVFQATKYSTDEHPHISSSDIRKALNCGDINLANNLLSYTYAFSGRVINGFEVGRKIGFPTANIQPLDAEKIIPSTGVYSVEVIRKNTILRGMMNIGYRPTLNNGNHISIEVHIFDFNQNIYNEIIEIRFLKIIRNEKKFDTIEELIQQLQADKIAAFL